MGIRNIFFRKANAEKVVTESPVVALQREVEQRTAIVEQVTNNVDRMNAELLEAMRIPTEEDPPKKK